MPSSVFDRRSILRGGALSVAASFLAACDKNTMKNDRSDSSQVTSQSDALTGIGSSGGRSGLLTPTFVPYTGVRPDIAAGEAGIPAGFYHYPARPPAFVSSVPGKGGSLVCMVQATSAATPANRNRWLQAVNKALGVDVKLQITPSADYPQKFQVALAGGMSADVAQFLAVPNTPQVLENEFSDLTPFLAGDNVKAYPGLASIPTSAWKIPTINGHIWGIPQARPPAGNVCLTRGDVLKKVGIGTSSPTISGGQEFLGLCKELTDHKTGRYAIGAAPNYWVLEAVLEMLNAPDVNSSSESDGVFTSVNELPQMKEALDEVTKMWNAGYIHPSSFASPGQSFTWWSAGTTALYFQSFAGWSAYATLYPTWDIGVVPLPTWNAAGPANKILGMAGYGAFAALRKTTDERVRELLGICDYLAAPFGTKEYLLANYGVDGVDYNLDGADPVETDAGKSEDPPGLAYIGSQRFANLYSPGNATLVDAQHKYLSDVLPNGYADPTWGLYSETFVTKGATANLNVQNAQADIIQGRKKISDWDSVVATWRAAAGDAMRGEYEKAYAEQH